MNLIEIISKQLITRDQLRHRFPNVSFANDLSTMSLADLATFGVAPFIHTSQPSSEFGGVSFGVPIEKDGIYYSNWIIEPLPIEMCKKIQIDKVSNKFQDRLFQIIEFKGMTITINLLNISILQLFSIGKGSFDFKTNDGWLKLTSKEAKELLIMIQQQVQNVLAIEKSHHDKIMALTNTEDVITYDINKI